MKNGDLNASNIATDSSDYSVNMDYTTNITLNGHMYKFLNMDPIDLWQEAYCYGDELVGSYDLTQSPFCFSKAYFVWYVLRLQQKRNTVPC